MVDSQVADIQHLENKLRQTSMMPSKITLRQLENKLRQTSMIPSKITLRQLENKLRQTSMIPLKITLRHLENKLRQTSMIPLKITLRQLEDDTDGNDYVWGVFRLVAETPAETHVACSDWLQTHLRFRDTCRDTCRLFRLAADTPTVRRHLQRHVARSDWLQVVSAGSHSLRRLSPQVSCARNFIFVACAPYFIKLFSSLLTPTRIFTYFLLLIGFSEVQRNMQHIPRSHILIKTSSTHVHLNPHTHHPSLHQFNQL